MTGWTFLSGSSIKVTSIATAPRSGRLSLYVDANKLIYIKDGGPTSTPTATSTSPAGPPATQGGLTQAEKVAIGLSAPLGAILLGLVGWLLHRRYSARRKTGPEANNTGTNTGLEASMAENANRSELDAAGARLFELPAGHEPKSASDFTKVPARDNRSSPQLSQLAQSVVSK